MRFALVAIMLLGAGALLAATPAAAAPPSLRGQAEAADALRPVVEAGRKSAQATKRTYRSKRRYSWTNRPYWRPYQYRYWQYYYPYGGPLF